MPFGGMLGSTFNFVFEVQMENLQNGDRFYYLQRLDGLHLFGEMENNSFAAMIMRNTDATHLPSDVFSTPGLILEVDQTPSQFNDLGLATAIAGEAPTRDSAAASSRRWSSATTRRRRARHQLPALHGDEHVVLGGTDGNITGGNDILIASIGDDTLFGDGGNDNLEGGFGNDIINGGDGDDIIKDIGGDDNIKAGDGNDVVHAGPGLDLVMGGDGQDFIFLGTDMGSEVFAGEGNDFIYGNKNAERILGNEGNDWIETGTFDGAPGRQLRRNLRAGRHRRPRRVPRRRRLRRVHRRRRRRHHGRQPRPRQDGRHVRLGLGDLQGQHLRRERRPHASPIVFDEARRRRRTARSTHTKSVEGLSGTSFNDILTGSDMLAEERAAVRPGRHGRLSRQRARRRRASPRIAGLQAVLGAGVTSLHAPATSSSAATAAT